jgi:inhibitor of cysteine peptidase
MLENAEISLAPIHEVDVYFMESFPVQVGVHIKGGLRDGCTTFHDAVVTQTGNRVNIEVTTQRPRDAMCTQVYGYFEENLNIGSNFTTGTTYTLKVNDYTTTFVYR